MALWASLRDVLHIAGFELLRALRTWQAVALVAVYGLATAWSTYIFVNVLGAIENEVARNLGLVPAEHPGAMLDRLVTSASFRDLVEGMIGSASILDDVLSWPVLAIFYLWIGIGLLPLFAASSSADALAGDVYSRAVRFQLLRTGRAELVAGRFVGQAVLSILAVSVSAVVLFGVGTWAMAPQEDLALALALVSITPRVWFFGLPFIGMGLAASQLTVSSAWARVLALGAVAGTWIAYGVARWASSTDRYAVLSDVVLQAVPQAWAAGLWQPGIGWLPSALVCSCLAVVIVLGGFLVFSRRNL